MYTQHIDMRPRIPDHIEEKLEEDPGIGQLNHLYEAGGHATKGEFIRRAIVEKIRRVENGEDTL